MGTTLPSSSFCALDDADFAAAALFAFLTIGFLTGVVSEDFALRLVAVFFAVLAAEAPWALVGVLATLLAADFTFNFSTAFLATAGCFFSD